MSTLSRKLKWLFKENAQLRDGSEAEADMDIRNWVQRNADLATEFASFSCGLTSGNTMEHGRRGVRRDPQKSPIPTSLFCQGLGLWTLCIILEELILRMV